MKEGLSEISSIRIEERTHVGLTVLRCGLSVTRTSQKLDQQLCNLQALLLCGTERYLCWYPNPTG